MIFDTSEALIENMYYYTWSSRVYREVCSTIFDTSEALIENMYYYTWSSRV